ncbi:hypothetical protein GCM10010423_38320 [Streptomyces levis]|uniref:Uncharacterized protein n=1 Tax=Streptomyces levis TaxID=285566 RepID=A0ABN3NU33_9ACTN
MTASRNLADSPDAISRYTGCVATLPTAHTIVSFIAYPSLARTRRRADTRTGPPRTAVSARLPPPGRAR